MGFLTSIPNYIHYSVCKQPPRPYSSIASKNFFCQKKILPTLKFKTNKPSGPRLDLYQVGFSQSPKLRNCCKNVHIFSPLECASWQMWKKKTLTATAAAFTIWRYLKIVGIFRRFYPPRLMSVRILSLSAQKPLLPLNATAPFDQ